MPLPAPSIALLTPTTIKRPFNFIRAMKKVCFYQYTPLTPLTQREKPSPRVVPHPRVASQPRIAAPDKIVDHRTISLQPISDLVAYRRTYPSKFLEKWGNSEVLHLIQALTVLYIDSGKSLEHHQLWRHPNLGPTWTTFYVNKLCHLCQGIGNRPEKTTQCIDRDGRVYSHKMWSMLVLS